MNFTLTFLQNEMYQLIFIDIKIVKTKTPKIVDTS